MTLRRPGFDLLSADRIRALLKTELLATKVYAFWSIGSTNEFAYRRAAQGEKEGVLVIAEEQTKGKGRKSRQWDSPFNKGLWFSLILRPPIAAEKAGLVPYFSGVSIAEAVENYIHLQPDLKWPNDLLFRGKKFCGILSEVEFHNSQIDFIILGIGINVNHKPEDFPEAYRERATSLRIESGLRIDRAELLAEVIHRLEANYRQILANGFAGILTTWKAKCPQFGQKMTIMQDEERIEGIFEDIDEDGCLLLRQPSGALQRIIAGDVAF